MGKEKKTGEYRVFLRGLAIALGLYLTGVCLLAFLMVKAFLPEQADWMILTGSGFGAALAGGIVSARRSSFASLPSGMLNTTIFLGVLILVGITAWPESFWKGSSVILAASIFLGGIVAGVWGTGKKKRRKRRHMRAVSK